MPSQGNPPPLPKGATTKTSASSKDIIIQSCDITNVHDKYKLIRPYPYLFQINTIFLVDQTNTSVTKQIPIFRNSILLPRLQLKNDFASAKGDFCCYSTDNMFLSRFK